MPKPPGRPGNRQSTPRVSAGDRPRGPRPDPNRADSGERPRGPRPDPNRADSGERPRGPRPDYNRSGPSDRPRGPRPDPNRTDSHERPRGPRPDPNRADSGERPRGPRSDYNRSDSPRPGGGYRSDSARPGQRPPRPGGYPSQGGRPGGGTGRPPRRFDNGSGGGGYDRGGERSQGGYDRGGNRGGDPGVIRRSVPSSQTPKDFCYGVNAVSEALSAGLVRSVYHSPTKSSARVLHLVAAAKESGVPIESLDRQGWAAALSPEQHQGVAAKLFPLPVHHLEEILASSKAESTILVLDRIQDPQNLGAILRTAAAAGVDCAVLPKAGAAPVTAAVHRASAGQSFRVPIVEGENLATALRILKEHGYWVVGCDAEGDYDATRFSYPARRVIVIGNEGEGMRRLVRETCDYVVSIPMDPQVESLNVSTAAAIVLYLAKAASEAPEGAAAPPAE